MSVNKLLLMLIFIPFICHSQKDDNYFILNNSTDFIYLVNGILNKENIEVGDNLFITSKENYNQYKQMLHEGYIKGEPPNIFGVNLMIKDKKIIGNCEFKELKVVDFGWLLKNKRHKYYKNNEQFIELNDFKNLSILLKQKKGFFIYKVYRIFSTD